MIYNKFNKYVHDLYFNEENIGNQTVMSVDRFVIKRFCNIHKITSIDLANEIKRKFRYSWSYALTSFDELPNMFGLVAMQIYIASLMHGDKKYSASNYNSRLSDLFGVSSNDLQTLLYKSFQDKLWQKLNKWAISNGFDLNIPDVGLGKGRYIQYPLSQALLNQEDFKNIPLMFEKNKLKPHENISFLDFKCLLHYSDLGNTQTTHYHRIKDRLIEKSDIDLMIYQIYTFYNNDWDGNYLCKESLNKTYKIHDSLHNCISIDKNRLEVIITNRNNNRIIERIKLIDCNLICKLKKCYKFYSHLKDKIIFAKDEIYDDWIEERYIEIGKDYLILGEKSHLDSKLISLLDPDYLDYSNNLYSMYIINVHKNSKVHSFWKDFFSKQQRSFSMENGLKLTRKSWMLGAGPDLIFNKKEAVWLNGQRILRNLNNDIYSLKNLPVGEYSLKEKDQSPIRFSIETPNIGKEDNVIGWKLSKELKVWEVVDEDYNFSGLTTFFESQTVEASARLWINSLIRNKKDNSSSVVINAINRSNNGFSRKN